MPRDDGYDDIRAAFLAGVAAAISAAFNKTSGHAPDVEKYVDRLKAAKVIPKLFE